MESELEPPVCITPLHGSEVEELFTILEPKFKSNGGLLRDRSVGEILHDIHEYFVVRIEDIITGTFQLRESVTPERFLELGAFLVCAERHKREQVKFSIIEFSRREANRKCLELISLTNHRSLQKFYNSVGAREEDSGIFPQRASISPGVQLYSFDTI